MYIYIHIYVCVCVCLCVYMCVCMCVCVNRVTRCFSDNTAWISSCAILFEASGTTLHRVFLRQCCPRSIKTTLHRIFLIKCCLESLGQYCIGFCPVQCCHKSIKLTLSRIFSYAMLSKVSWTTLRRVLTCVMLSLEY